MHQLLYEAVLTPHLLTRPRPSSRKRSASAPGGRVGRLLLVVRWDSKSQPAQAAPHTMDLLPWARPGAPLAGAAHRGWEPQGHA